MGWQDRDYSRIGDARFRNPLMNFLFGSVPLGTWFGIRVRLHSTLILWVIFEFLFSGTKYGLGPERTAISLTVLFTIVLLHEFGHCLGAHLVGGHSDEILLWPLGGLAYAQPPHRPLPTFITVAAGPAVNVIISAITGTALALMGHFSVDWLNPLLAFSGKIYVPDDTYQLLGAGHLVGWLFWFFTTSNALFFFNLLPIYPLDGGRMLQTILWRPLGYVRSTDISCIVGMGGAVAGFIVGLFFNGGGMLMFLAIAGFLTCWQQRRMLQYMATEEASDSQYDLSAAWEQPERVHRRKKIKKRWFNAARKRALAEQAEQARIDSILDKVKEKGLHSLTWWERRALRKATERQRQRDLAERL